MSLTREFPLVPVHTVRPGAEVGCVTVRKVEVLAAHVALTMDNGFILVYPDAHEIIMLTRPNPSFYEPSPN